MVSRRDFLRSGTLTGAAVFSGTAALLGREPYGVFGARGDLASALRSLPGGRVRDFKLNAAPAEWDAGDGRRVAAWLYNGTLPGPELRVREGDVVRVALTNSLPEPTTIHWHGVPVPFGMDGVPGLTQPAVRPGERFVYEFVAEVPGTYWFHSHFADQFERGLFGALVVEPRTESLAYDVEHVLILDDWLHDFDHAQAAEVPHNSRVGGTAMGSMQMEGDIRQMVRNMAMSSERTGAPARDGPPGHGVPQPEPAFQAHTVNGRRGDAVPPISVRRGQRVRFRFINAGTATVYPLYLAGHRFTVTHMDGQPVAPFATDALIIGMGERVDALVEAVNPGVWTLGSVDAAQRESGLALTLSYDGFREARPQLGTVPTVPARPYQGAYGAIQARRQTMPMGRSFDLSLRMASPTLWTINGKAYPDADAIEVREGERVRLTLRNNSAFAHPMHLHGHFFDVVRPYGATEDVEHPLRKDTLTLYHMDQHVIEFGAGNPGASWLLHCHNQYHHTGGMATIVRYT